MWCDNCCLVFPLRAGGMVLATIMAVNIICECLCNARILNRKANFLSLIDQIYSIAGGIVLFNYGGGYILVVLRAYGYVYICTIVVDCFSLLF